MRLVQFEVPEQGGDEEEQPDTCSECSLSLLANCSSGGWLREGGARRRCPNYATHLRQVALANCGIPALYQNATLESFRTAKLRGSRQLAENLAACHRWLKGTLGATRSGLLLAGPTGTGKTHLAAALLRAVIEQHPIVIGRFEDMTALVHALQRTIDREKNGREGLTESEILLPALSADLLVLDDIGARRATPYQTDLLYLIVNHRYSATLPTIFTTNLLPGKGLEEHIGPRTFSRLHESCARPFLLFDRADDFRRLTP